MACLATKGRLLPCKEFVGGLFKIWFLNYGTISGNTLVNGTVTVLGNSASLYEYELKGTSKLIQEITSSRENGTTFVTQTLTLDMAGGDQATNNEIKLLAYGRPHVIVQDNYGSAWLVGRMRGSDLTTGTLDFGAAYGDKYGYSLTFVAMENEYANFLSGSTLASAFGGLTDSATVISAIVKGT